MSQKQESTINNFEAKYCRLNEDGRGLIRVKNSHSALQRGMKRSVDVVAALLFFLFFGWLYLIVWLCVLVTTGAPAIYSHTRVGRDAVEFGCLKFRSMVVDSDVILQRHLAANPEAKSEWERDFKLRDDPRITKFGRIIRKTSLDELPQFWNVLRGEMSLVGPRPVVMKELEKYYGDASAFYLSIKPGITGPWQVGGRNDLDYSQRIQLDTAYAQKWSIWGDFIILFKTIIVVFARRGSY